MSVGNELKKLMDFAQSQMNTIVTPEVLAAMSDDQRKQVHEAKNVFKSGGNDLDKKMKELNKLMKTYGTITNK